MEVHHPHHPTHKKKWTEYLLEFLMLFLAVFLGFVAENLREHQAENKMEKEYIHSLATDVKRDIVQIDSIQVGNLNTQQLCDSFLTLLQDKEVISNSYHAFTIAAAISGFMDFVPNDGTIQQLKSSGGLRVIKNKEVREKMMDYYKTGELIKIHQSAMNSYLLQMGETMDIFNIPQLMLTKGNAAVPLLSHTEKEISKEYLYILRWKLLLKVLSNAYFETEKTKGEYLLHVIQEEYHLSE